MFGESPIRVEPLALPLVEADLITQTSLRASYRGPGCERPGDEFERRADHVSAFRSWDSVISSRPTTMSGASARVRREAPHVLRRHAWSRIGVVREAYRCAIFASVSYST